MMRLRLFAIFALCLSLAACGYHLRGSTAALSFAVQSIQVVSVGAGQVAHVVKQRLEQSAVKVVDNPEQAQAILTLSGERYDNRVLSVDPSDGKVLEYEIDYQVGVAITRPDGTAIRESQPISLSRDLTFDPDAVLGKADEQQTVRADMLQDAAQSVLFRLQSVDATELEGP